MYSLPLPDLSDNGCIPVIIPSGLTWRVILSRKPWEKFFSNQHLYTYLCNKTSSIYATLTGSPQELEENEFGPRSTPLQAKYRPHSPSPKAPVCKTAHTSTKAWIKVELLVPCPPRSWGFGIPGTSPPSPLGSHCPRSEEVSSKI